MLSGRRSGAELFVATRETGSSAPLPPLSRRLRYTVEFGTASRQRPPKETAAAQRGNLLAPSSHDASTSPNSASDRLANRPCAISARRSSRSTGPILEFAVLPGFPGSPTWLGGRRPTPTNGSCWRAMPRTCITQSVEGASTRSSASVTRKPLVRCPCPCTTHPDSRFNRGGGREPHP